MSDRLWARHLDGDDLSPSEQDELLATLDADPSERERRLADQELDGVLRVLGRGAEDGERFVRQVGDRLAAERSAAPFVERVRERIAQEAAPRRSPRRRGAARRRSSRPVLAPVLLLAASLLIGVAAIVFLSSGERPEAKGERASGRTRELPPQPVVAPGPVRETEPRPTPAPPRETAPAPPVKTSSPPPRKTTKTATPRRPKQPRRPLVPLPVERPKTATPRVAIEVVKLEGKRWKVRRGKKWRALSATSLRWRDGVGLQARGAPGRLTLADGTVLSLKSRAVVEVLAAKPPTILLEKGELYCSVPRPAGKTQAEQARFVVRTNQGAVEVVGTEFGVRASSSRTTVVVTAGVVECVTAKGRERVPAGFSAKLRRDQRPVRRPGARAFKWLRRLEPPQRLVFRYDFEDGKLPVPWTPGLVKRGPPRGKNRYCLETEAKPDGATVHLSLPKEHQTRAGERVLRFRYFANGDQIAINVKNERWGDNCKYLVERTPRGVWERIEIPLWKCFPGPGTPDKADRTKPIRGGHRLTHVHIRFLGGTLPSYVDDVEIVELVKR